MDLNKSTFDKATKKLPVPRLGFPSIADVAQDCNLLIGQRGYIVAWLRKIICMIPSAELV